MIDIAVVQFGDRLKRADGVEVDVLWTTVAPDRVHVVAPDGTETDEPPDALSPLE